MPEHKPQVKIISNGMSHGTEIWVDDKLLTCASKVSWTVAYDEVATATIVIDGPLLDVTGELTEVQIKELVHEANNR